jgi:hypothetical protein
MLRSGVLKNPVSKITKAKWTRDVAQEIEHLLCKCEALSSNPSPIKKKKKPAEIKSGKTYYANCPSQIHLKSLLFL